MKTVLKLALEALELAVECGGELDRSTYLEAQRELQAAVDEVVRYDRKMNAEERAPDGSDYNELLSMLGLGTDESQAATSPGVVAA